MKTSTKMDIITAVYTAKTTSESIFVQYSCKNEKEMEMVGKLAKARLKGLTDETIVQFEIKSKKFTWLFFNGRGYENLTEKGNLLFPINDAGQRIVLGRNGHKASNKRFINV